MEENIDIPGFAVSSIDRLFGIEDKDIRSFSPLTLAYIGDAVYEVYIRKYVLGDAPAGVNRMNRRVIRYVCADGQAKIAKELIKGFLSEDEIKLLKRGRNNTKTPKPRGSSPVDYKMATGFEALIGYLHLNGNVKRLEEIIRESIEIIEREGNL